MSVVLTREHEVFDERRKGNAQQTLHSFIEKKCELTGPTSSFFAPRTGMIQACEGVKKSSKSVIVYRQLH